MVIHCNVVIPPFLPDATIPPFFLDATIPPFFLDATIPPFVLDAPKPPFRAIHKLNLAEFKMVSNTNIRIIFDILN